MHAPPSLIGLYSPAPQSGKSTTAKYLALHHGYKVVPFAGLLKEMMRPMLTAFGYSSNAIAALESGDKSEKIIGDVTLRKMYQTLGTEWGRALHSEIWVRAWEHRVATLMASNQRVVVDDMRFPNEFHAVTRIGGEVWKITRKAASVGAAHASEGALNSSVWDREIPNDEGIEDLFIRLCTIMRPAEEEVVL